MPSLSRKNSKFFPSEGSTLPFLVDPIQNDKSKLQEPVKLPILIAHLGHMCMQLSMDVDLDIRLTTVFAKPGG